MRLSLDSAEDSTDPSGGSFCSSVLPSGNPVTVLFEHLMQILDDAKAVVKHGLADRTHQDGWSVASSLRMRISELKTTVTVVVAN